MKNILLFFSLLVASANMLAQQPEDYFITKWENPGWGNITIPTNSVYTYNYTVDWGDGSPISTHTGNASHVYSTAGIYTIKISGTFPQFYNNGVWNEALKSIEQWGNIQWKSMARSFKTVRNMAINSIDNPDLSQVTDMSEMFYQSGEFNGDISGWDVSNVKNMSLMFFQCPAFNQDIGNWNVSNVTDMSHMFEKTPFNQDIGNWDVSSVTTMASMFSENVVFNQDIGRWNINNVTTMHNMFNGNAGALSPANYDALLRGWSTLSLPNVIDFNQPLLKYCTAGAARAIMEQKGWIFNDGGTNCLGSCTTETTWNGSAWSNGLPTSTKKAVFAANYNTATSGSIDACSIQINPGFTLTVAPGTTIKVQRDLAIDGNLIFQSDATGNGELAKLGEKAAVVGDATVHRFMLEKRSYRMVSPAVTTSSNIRANWQEGVNNVGIPYSQNQNPNPGFGTHITGSTTGANGFDATGTGAPSLYTVDVAAQQFQVVGNTNLNKLTAGEAYLMMVRGDRDIDLTNNFSYGQTTLRSKGKLSWGKKHLKFVSPRNGAFIMFGNPFQSAVNMNTVLATSTNVNKNFYYVYDPNIGTNGAYVTVYLPTGNNNNGETMNVPPSSANQYLQPGQGAQLATLAPGGVTLDFLESDKAPGQFTPTNATGNTTVMDGMVMGQLFTQENYTNGGPVHDAFALLFAEENDNELTPADAVKPFNFYENIGIDHNGTYLSIEKRALPRVGENFPLYISGFQTNAYVLEIKVNGLEGALLYLDDAFTGSSTVLQEAAVAYPFSVSASNPESKATDRFSIRVAERLNIDENVSSSGISFYPNPVSDLLKINNLDNIQLNSASIYDITGRLIKTVDLKGATAEVSISVSDLSNATYLIILNSENGTVSNLLVKK
ncbi:BspA family leucine-rich repeat surface protein [Aequorivita sp. H23M31]|uniref:BspA family leucine-rich repeat surface protein n=1 Tax=Aequorivita ciconiae TaxID=2494375 RepID=A0A410FZQ5_9FLAO|nr:BspA family leucine-rich repeat surface protein [Aequorivita sp. H23M31]QAA80471.1 BspA family leucine-rich repeat surface protein [Aequorivita sp. H23M31]